MQVLLPTFVHTLISERQDGHLGLMRQQGLTPGAYYTAMYVWTLLAYIVFMVVFAGVGAIIGLSIFTKTAFGVQARVDRPDPAPMADLGMIYVYTPAPTLLFANLMP